MYTTASGTDSKAKQKDRITVDKEHSSKVLFTFWKDKPYTDTIKVYSFGERNF